MAKPLGAFVRAVLARSAAPGGGSVSAAAGALVCAPLTSCPFAASGTHAVHGGWLFWPAKWQMTHLVSIQMSQKVSGLLEEAKQGSVVVLALLDKRAA